MFHIVHDNHEKRLGEPQGHGKDTRVKGLKHTRHRTGSGHSKKAADENRSTSRNGYLSFDRHWHSNTQDSRDSIIDWHGSQALGSRQWRPTLYETQDHKWGLEGHLGPTSTPECPSDLERQEKGRERKGWGGQREPSRRKYFANVYSGVEC